MAMDPRQGVKDEFTERDVRLSCSLCMEPYKGRNPKILPCFHTFCLPCLVSLEASATTAASGTRDNAVEESDDLKGSQAEKKVGVDENGGGCGGDAVAVGGADGGKAVFLCPTCRAPVSVPKGGVSALQTNFYIVQEQSADEASPPVLCDMCEEGNQQPATHHCQQCQIGICRSCRRYHDKLMPKHHVAAAGLGQRGKMEKEKEEEKKGGLCLVHRDQVLCFHCCQCEVSMCLHCKLTLHEGHDSVDLAAAALQAKKEMSSLLTLTQQQLQVLESSIQRADQEDCQLTRHTKQATQHINARYEILVAWAQDARDQLMEEVKAKEASSRAQLAAEKSSTTLVHDSLSSLLTRASHAVSTDPAGVIMVKNELKEALLPDEKLESHRKRAERDDPPWGWDYSALDASVLHADDVKVYMGRVAEGPDLGVGKPPVSLRELANRMDRWMNEMTKTTNSMTSQLTSCTNDVTALQKKEAELEQKLKSVDDRITASKQKQDDLQGKVEWLTTDTQKKFSSLSDKIATQNKSAADLQKTTESLKKKMETSGKMISFIAKGLDTEKTKDGSPIIFSSAEVNDGGCYDTATGYFTVTIPGCYMFTSSIGSGGGQDTVVKAYIVVDSRRYTFIRGSYTSVGCGSISVQLQKGQKVCVRADCSSNNYCGSEVWFSGALVQPQL